MTSKLKSAMLVFFSALLLLPACKKEDNRTRPELLASASCWALTKREVYNAGTTQWVDNQLQNCEKDDCYTYTSDGNYTKNEGATKCITSGPQVVSGTWALSTDEQMLTRIENNASFTFSVVELTAERMVLEGSVLGFQTRFTWEAR
jgi:hypothetical protein